MENGFNNLKIHPDYDENNDNRKDFSYFKKVATSSYDQWHSQSVQNATALNTITVVTSTIRFIPLALPKRTRLDRIGCQITAGGSAASVGRLGIYDSVNMVPNNLIIDAGTVSTAAAAVLSIEIDITLEAGFYFLALTTSSVANVTFRAVVLGGIPNFLGSLSTLGTSVASQLFITFTYGVFPQNVLNSSFNKLSAITPLISLRYKKEN